MFKQYTLRFAVPVIAIVCMAVGIAIIGSTEGFDRVNDVSTTAHVQR